VDVVADLMLHDLDWISRGVGEEIDEVRATGRVGEAGRLDEAEAQLHFRSGCTARLVVSRTHPARRRFVRIEGSRGTATADLLSGVVQPALGEGRPSLSGEAPDPLGAQWRDFLAATRQRTQPVNDGAVGLAALRLVERVRAAIGIGGPGAEVEAGEARDDDSHLRR
jgi:predicted dehydrogenase